ncbi:MAG: NAD(+) synthase [Planctomycetota bacterium]|jgi:NAD+ synthase
MITQGKNVSFPKLSIDCEKVAGSVIFEISRIVNSYEAGGILLGLSGGIDSAVLAALSVKALSPEKVRAFYLYDMTSDASSSQNAQLVANHLSISLVSHDITPEVRKQGIYDSLLIKMMLNSKKMASFLSRGIIDKESPFVYTLRHGNFDGSRIKQFVYDRFVRPVEHAFCQRHIYRRKFLEQKALDENCIVLGAANRSEVMTGWFIKDGIDDMEHSPISHLYKTQIYQLAEYLDIPEEIINQAASPDMLKGVTDELAIGISYREMDVILYGMENGLGDKEIIEAGITQEQIDYVRKLHELSSWKRTSDIDPCRSSVVPETV